MKLAEEVEKSLKTKIFPWSDFEEWEDNLAETFEEFCDRWARRWNGSNSLIKQANIEYVTKEMVESFHNGQSVAEDRIRDAI